MLEDVVEAAERWVCISSVAAANGSIYLENFFFLLICTCSASVLQTSFWLAVFVSRAILKISEDNDNDLIEMGHTDTSWNRRMLTGNARASLLFQLHLEPIASVRVVALLPLLPSYPSPLAIAISRISYPRPYPHTLQISQQRGGSISLTPSVSPSPNCLIPQLAFSPATSSSLTSMEVMDAHSPRR